MTRKQRYEGILSHFREHMPEARSELHFGNAFELIVAVVLSAQCTDKRVNLVTPALLAAFPTPEAMAQATFDELFPYVRSVSYPNSKTQHLIALAQKLVAEFGGEVPSDIDLLMSLPGVGRKTANVVASIIYDKPVIAVDTHVFRVSHRLGLSDGRTPDAVERDLERHIPPADRPTAHHWLILHGRYICTAHRPKCGQCAIRSFCKEGPFEP